MNTATSVTLLGQGDRTAQVPGRDVMAEVDVFWVDWTVLGWNRYTKWVVYVWFASFTTSRTQLSCHVGPSFLNANTFLVDLVSASNISKQVSGYEGQIERCCEQHTLNMSLPSRKSLSADLRT